VLRLSAASKFSLFRWQMATEKLTPILDDGTSYSPLYIRLSPDGRYLYFLQDEKGNELGHLMRLTLDDESELVDVTPDMTPYSLRGLEISAAGNMVTFTAVSEADGYQLCCIPLTAEGKPGPLRRIHQHPMEFWEAVPSHSGELIAIKSTHRTGNRRYSSLVFDSRSGELVAELWDGPEHSVEVRDFSPVAQDYRLLLTTTVSGFRRPVIWQPLTNERQDVELPHLPGDLLPLGWSPDARQILLKQFNRAVEQLYLYEVAVGKAARLAHPEGSFDRVYFAPDGRILAHWQNASTPMRLIELDNETGAQTQTLLGADDMPFGRSWRSIEFSSSDGVMVHGWLATPEGAGPFPTILHTHGGPHVVQVNGFSASAQAWLDHGFAFATINYRGSTTFGEEFRGKIWGNIGHWELEDMVAARDWLVTEGISDPQAIILNGASYGGYLTLWGLGKRPDLWVGGIARVAIADWAINYEDAAGAMQGAFRNWFLGSPEEKLAQYKASSPISYAEQVQAPLFIYQGKNDTRTSARQMELYEAKMKALGKDITVQWFDAGHTGGSDVAKAVALQEEMMQIARRILLKS
jgi:dipeptidyl aminopeptidase/acylaminoacyl peptidase